MSANAALLTQLGQALGCDPSQAISSRIAEERIDGLPARCYYAGPLIDPVPQRRPPKPQLESLTYLDREARELAERGRADIIRFCQMMRRVRMKP